MFGKVWKEHAKTLELYVPIVARVHGEHHPEFFEVEKLYNQIKEKVTKDPSSLFEEFENLRKVTDNYTVPGDVCESYEAVYVMLSKADAAYSEDIAGK